MKKKLGLLGLAGIPLALIGMAAASVALAAPVAPVPVQSVAATQEVPASDAETNDDSSVSATHAQGTASSDGETNDDQSGPQEAPGVEQAD